MIDAVNAVLLGEVLECLYVLIVSGIPFLIFGAVLIFAESLYTFWRDNK